LNASCAASATEGITAAKAHGVYMGRRPVIDAAEIRRLRDQEQIGA
jgi:hypothetical protein